MLSLLPYHPSLPLRDPFFYFGLCRPSYNPAFSLIASHFSDRLGFLTALTSRALLLVIVSKMRAFQGMEWAT